LFNYFVCDYLFFREWLSGYGAVGVRLGKNKCADFSSALLFFAKRLPCVIFTFLFVFLRGKGKNICERSTPALPITANV